MAEQFVIRVQVDNLETRSAEPRVGQGAKQGTGVGASGTYGDLTALATKDIRQTKPYEVTMNGVPVERRKFLDPRNSKSALGPERVLHKEEFVPGTNRKERVMMSMDPESGGIDELWQQQTFKGAVHEFKHKHKARIRATGTIAINSAISMGINISSHRSGDTYRNSVMRQSASNASSMASIGIAGAIWGPTAAIAFTANFAISTGTRMITEAVNFHFDRKMDTLYLHNMTQVTGDLSYGRSRS